MDFHQLTFLAIEGDGLEENQIGNVGLADVVRSGHP
jgi:hypothetical protein